MTLAFALLRLRSLIAGLGQFIAKHPWQAVCLLLALWGCWEHHRAQSWHDYAKRLEAAERASVASLKAAKVATETKRAAITKDTNHATPEHRSAALAANGAYAASHRVRWTPPAPAAGQAGTGLPEPATPARRTEADASGTDMVAISRADLDACTLNTSDLNDAYEWARKTWGTP